MYEFCMSHCRVEGGDQLTLARTKFGQKTGVSAHFSSAQASFECSGKGSKLLARYNSAL